MKPVKKGGRKRGIKTFNYASTFNHTHTCCGRVPALGNKFLRSHAAYGKEDTQRRYNCATDHLDPQPVRGLGAAKTC